MRSNFAKFPGAFLHNILYRVYFTLSQGSAGPGPFGLRSGGGDRVLAGSTPCPWRMPHMGMRLGPSASERAFSTTPNARSPVVGVDAARSRRRRFHCVLCNKRRTNQEPRRHVPNCLCRVSTLPLPHYNLYTIFRGSRVPLNYIITSCDCTFSPPYAASHPWCCCFGPCPWGPCPCWPCSCAPRPWCRSSSAGRPP